MDVAANWGSALGPEIEEPTCAAMACFKVVIVSTVDDPRPGPTLVNRYVTFP